MALESMQEIFDRASSGDKEFWQVVLDTDMDEREVTAAESMERMRTTWQAMLDSVDHYQPQRRSVSGLVGGDGERMRQYAKENESLSGPYLQEVIATALSVGESNACMCKIVAAPTAGACGVLPAVLVPLYKQGAADEETILRALYVASGIGAVIAYRACIAGAAGGCQAEIGSASAMAAGALTAIRGGDNAQIGHAVAMALKNLMGLVCDPVAGLVEIPCIKRNASGVAGAFVAAELALAGIESAIPADEVIVAMKKVGDAMSPALKETAEGGLAATPTARRLYEQVFGRPAESGCTGCGGCARGR